MWKQHKPEGLQITWLSNNIEYDIWLIDFRFGTQCYDVEDVFFTTDNAPVVNGEDEEDRKFTARNMLLSYLRSSYLQLVQNIEDPKDIFERIRQFRDPWTNAASIAAWLALHAWKYDTNLDISQNIAAYERITARYNTCGEQLSLRMHRDIFVYSLPSKAKTKILAHIRMVDIKDATFYLVVSLLYELERERKVSIIERNSGMACYAKPQEIMINAPMNEKRGNIAIISLKALIGTKWLVEEKKIRVKMDWVRKSSSRLPD